MATPFPGLQHRDGGGGVAVMAGPVNAIDPSPSKACVKNNPALKPPILIFLFFHKAIRSELEGLHRAAMAFATGAGDIKPLLERYHFLRAIYKHHCNAEDEVRVCVRLIFVSDLEHFHNTILLSVCLFVFAGFLYQTVAQF
jgi:zinc finger-like protein